MKRKSETVSVEIPAATVELWLSSPLRGEKTDAEVLATTLQHLVEAYGDFPRRRTERDERSITILRHQMIDQAIRFSKPGDSAHNVTHAASLLLDDILGRAA